MGNEKKRHEEKMAELQAKDEKYKSQLENLRQEKKEASPDGEDSKVGDKLQEIQDQVDKLTAEFETIREENRSSKKEIEEECEQLKTQLATMNEEAEARS